MRELSVSTQTTPAELAGLFNSLLPDDEVGGRPGSDGEVILYVCSDDPCSDHAADPGAAIAARVAIDVVLQHVYGMPGVQPLLANVWEQLAGDTVPKAGWLAPPLTVLARLYRKTMSALPDSAQTRLLPRYARIETEGDAAEQAHVTPEQRQALETLIDRLMQLPCPSKQPDSQQYPPRR